MCKTLVSSVVLFCVVWSSYGKRESFACRAQEMKDFAEMAFYFPTTTNLSLKQRPPDSATTIYPNRRNTKDSRFFPKPLYHVLYSCILLCRVVPLDS